MVTQRDVERGLRDLGLDRSSHVLVHTSYKSLSGVDGGPIAVVRALVETLGTLMMPAFTSDRTFVWDARGVVAGNAYPPEPQANGRAAEPFTYDTPANKTMGVINETFRTTFPVYRSPHPSMSFIAHGVLAEELVGPGTEFDGLEPIRRLMEAGGDVLLLGVTHTNSTAIHLAEQLAGREMFVRYALTPDGVRAGSGGGCGLGFDAIEPLVTDIERRVVVENATLRCYLLARYVRTARELIEQDPFALLCNSSDCDRCNAHRSRLPV